VRYLSENEALQDSPSNHAYLAEWGTAYRQNHPQAFTVGEVWTDNLSVKKYVETNTELTSAFNFDLSSAMFKSVNESNNSIVRFAIQKTVQHFPEQDNANFITNHDMNRVMSQLGTDREAKARTLAGILLTAPGIPFIYYGEEIGMTGTKPDELIRTPMQWASAQGGGFTEGTPWEAINPDFPILNVDNQIGDSTSLLEHYRKLIQLRNLHPALRVGKTYMVGSNSNKLVSYLRVSEIETLTLKI
jgi:glycosidase